ncbi:MAG: 50S ribosome-binding GTPase [Propionibacteriaceae bacterium]|jgi:GTP-binding protein EngB required for normal cell division|nr:50S ribosome-binding GTPase [Propionibacteriaceae bacterium]
MTEPSVNSGLTVPQTLRALQELIDSCRGRVDEALVDQAQALANRADQRLSMAGDTTVVAIAGATGAGKSTLFNALSRTALAETGVRRPTTSQAMSVTFGTADASELLSWLGIPRRHSAPGRDLTDLVLIDLPDYDSTVQRHRDEVDRLVNLVDVILWVVDPQKYADAALHERYLIPLSSHADVMLFVLNQIDRVRPEQVDKIRSDMAQLLVREGIGGVEIHALSAATGQGVEQLRQVLREVAARKQAVAARLLADVTAMACRLRQEVATDEVGELSQATVDRLDQAIASAAGVDDVTDAVEVSWRQRGAIATGWPILTWRHRLRSDPLRRLQAKTRASAEADEAVRRTVLRSWRPVPQARLDSALRAMTDDSIAQLPRGWQDAIQRAARLRQGELPELLDQAIAAADLGLTRRPGWWSLARLAQWLFFIAFVGGLLWWAGALLWPSLPRLTVGPLAGPPALALGGLVAGLLLAGLSRLAVGVQARAKAATAGRRLRRAIGQVTQLAVVAPVNEELRRHNQARAALNRLLSPRRLAL